MKLHCKYYVIVLTLKERLRQQKLPWHVASKEIFVASKRAFFAGMNHVDLAMLLGFRFCLLLCCSIFYFLGFILQYDYFMLLL